MRQPDFSEIVDHALASLGGSPTSREVEAAATRLLEAQFRGPEKTRNSAIIPSVRCSISVASCSSRRSSTQRARVYDHVRRHAGELVQVLEDAASTLGLSAVPALDVGIRDSSSLFSGHEASEFLSIAEAIHQAATDAGAHSSSGLFLDLSLPENFRYLDLLPDCLNRFSGLVPVVQIGTDQAPPPDDVLYALGLTLAIFRQHKLAHDTQIAVVVNGCDRRAFGRRLHDSVIGLSVAFTQEDDVAVAYDLGTRISDTCTACLRLVQLEHRLGSTAGVPDGLAGSGRFRGVRLGQLLDGYPRFGDLQNRVSFPDLFSAEEMAAFLGGRLIPFSYLGNEVGLVVDVRPSP